MFHSLNYLQASSIATATATVAPTIGLLPIPKTSEFNLVFNRCFVSISQEYLRFIYKIPNFI